MTAVTGSCSICKRKFEAPNPARLATVIGSHKSWMHTDRRANVAASANPKSIEEVRRAARERWYRIRGQDPEEAEAAYQARKRAKNGTDADRRAAKTEQQRRYREMLRVRKYRESKQAQNGEQQFQRANCNECPHCHTRFYMVIPNESR